jgi:hypothetical protein
MSGQVLEHATEDKNPYGWLAVEAVCREPFSAVNSLLTGKITGNIDD